MSQPKRPNIFEFDDYRKYFAAWFDWMKKIDPLYSHRQFCKTTGFKSPNHLLLIIQGRRNLSLKTLNKYIETMELKENEVKYFELLIRFNHADDMAAKARYLKELSAHWKKGGKLLQQEQYNCLSNWQYAAIRELVNLEGFRENENWIAKKLNGHITPAQIRKAIKALLELKLLERDKNGKLVQSCSYLTTGEETNAVVAYLFHEQMMQLGIEALKEVSPDYRNISSLTFTIRPEDYPLIVGEMTEFRERLCSLLENRSEKDKDKHLYQLNIHFFPIGEL